MEFTEKSILQSAPITLHQQTADHSSLMRAADSSFFRPGAAARRSNTPDAFGLNRTRKCHCSSGINVHVMMRIRVSGFQPAIFHPINLSEEFEFKVAR